MDQLIDRSHATAPFKSAVRRFLNGSEADLIDVRGYAPRVKIERVLAQLLAAEPALPIERVSVSGRSGCADFSGEMTVVANGQPHVISFVWDCRWRAEQEGWTDYFGFPDQIRAAREFGWDCFQRWDVRAPIEAATSSFSRMATA
jgi:hypothetical protein